MAYTCLIYELAIYVVRAPVSLDGDRIMSDDIELLANASNSILEYKSESEKKFESKVEAENIAAAKKFAKEREITKAFSEYLEVKESILKEAVGKNAKNEQYVENDEFNLSDVLESKRRTIEHALEIVLEKLHAQTAAVFLVDKDGWLKRFVLSGHDASGHKIRLSWYEEERYERENSSFVGSAAMPREGSSYGKIRYTSDLSAEPNLSTEGKQRYLQKCGPLKSAIAIPLHGRGKIYGVLRVINKVNAETHKLDTTSVFDSYDDVVWLSLLANNVANVLSDFAWRAQTKILSYFHRALSDPPDVLEYYQKAVDLLVQTPETLFKAAVLRVFDPKTENLRVVSTSLSNDLIGKRKNIPHKLGYGMAGWVAENKQHLILHHIRLENKLVRFRDKDWINHEWIRANNFQAFGCFPLISENTILGTLSFYTRCSHNFYADVNEFTFLKNITESIATFTLLRVFRDSSASSGTEQIQRTLFDFLSDFNSDITVGTGFDPLEHKRRVEAVESALRDRKYDFRTVKGIARCLEIDTAKVAGILEEEPFVRKVLLKDKDGADLYTHRKRKTSLREFLAIGQNILSVPFYGIRTGK